MFSSTMPLEKLMRLPFPSYHPLLEYARKLVRSDKPDDKSKAVDLLKHLRQKYPHVLSVGQELVFALLEVENVPTDNTASRDEAERILSNLESQFLTLDEETLCRWGRFYKDCGDEFAPIPGDRSQSGKANDHLASDYYRRSLNKYLQAYRIRSGHYPGINAATIHLILGSLHPSNSSAEWYDSRELAKELLKNRADWPVESDKDRLVWHPATEGEAYLLLQGWETAIDKYQSAISHERSLGHPRGAMRLQIERILAAFDRLNVEVPDKYRDLDKLFNGMIASVDATTSTIAQPEIDSQA